MLGAESLLRTLVANGVDICFMNPGTSEMQFVAALDRVPGMRGVLCLFEGVCSGAADGYARMAGRPAATLLHLGPGLANGLSNFHNARKARSPIVSIVGEHSTQHLEHDAPLSADVEAFARPVSDDIIYLRRAADMGIAAAKTIEAARRPPGQVSMLIVPADYSWSEAGEPGPVIPGPCRATPPAAGIEEAARLIRSRKNVGIILSGTALHGRGLQAAGRLAAATGVRVFANRNAGRMESGRGRFQPERVPYFPEAALATLAGLQHLLLVESKAPVSFFGYPEQPSLMAPADCKLHVVAGLEEDGTAVLETLVEMCGAQGSTAAARSAPAATLPGPGPLTLPALAQAVGALLPEHAIVSDEMVSSGEPVWNRLLCAAPHDHLPVAGGSIGQGLPVAVGAAIACPDRKVVALEADGSGMYTLQSLWTMARESLDVTTVIFANHRYRILDVEMRRTGANGFGPLADAMIGIGRPDIDWVKLSEGLGVPAVRATTTEAFVTEFGRAVRERGPRLIEAALPA